MVVNTHKVTTDDGEHYSLLVIPPKDKPLQKVILCLPAMGVPARKYLHLAESLCLEGFACAIFELRGIGSSSVRASRKSNFGYHEILNFDLPKAIEEIHRLYPGNPVYLLGHSLGGQLGLLFMSLHPQQISGLIGVATGTPYYKGWRFPHNIGIWGLSKVMRLVSFGIGHYPGRKLGFAGREARKLIKDWAFSVGSGNYRANGSTHHFEDKFKMLNQPALMLTIEDDHLAPPSSIKNLGNKLEQSQVTYHHLTKDDFERDSLGHFNWMKEAEPITKKIMHWIE